MIARRGLCVATNGVPTDGVSIDRQIDRKVSGPAVDGLHFSSVCVGPNPI